MQHDNEQPTPKPDKAAPTNVSGDNIADAKEKTTPLQADEDRVEDEREGKWRTVN